MSEPTIKKGLTRRTFLKSTVAVAGATALVGGTSSLAAFADDEAQNSSTEETICYGVCRSNCMQSCRYAAHVVDGKLS